MRRADRCCRRSARCAAAVEVLSALRRRRLPSGAGRRPKEDEREGWCGFKVGYLVGSLATQSLKRRLAKALVSVSPPELQLAEITFKDLPLHSYDYDADYPPVESMRQFLGNLMTEFHGFIARVYSALPRNR